MLSGCPTHGNILICPRSVSHLQLSTSDCVLRVHAMSSFPFCICVCLLLGYVLCEEPSTAETNYGFRLADSFSLSADSAREQQVKEDNSYSPGINAILNSDGFLAQMDKLSGGESKYAPTGPVEAAVHTKKTIEVIPVKFEEPRGGGDPQVIEISPYEVPLSIVFKTQTNKIHVNQEHKTETAQEVKETTSEEEPHRVVHNVYRPVIQQINEIVQPIRELKQYVEPVIENMKTIIAKSGPPDGEQKATPQSKSFYNPKPNADLIRFNDNRNTGFNEMGTGQSSEAVKKYTSFSSLPQSSSLTPAKTTLMTPAAENEKKLSEMSKRYGFTNGFNKDTNNIVNGGNNNIAAKVEMIDVGKDANYNEIINGYIHNLIETKHARQMAESQIDPKTIQVVSLPLAQTNNINSDVKAKTNYKILQEFRISIDEASKKLKVTPVTAFDARKSDNNRSNLPQTLSPNPKPKSQNQQLDYDKFFKPSPKIRKNNDNGKRSIHNKIKKRFGLSPSKRVHSFRRRYENIRNNFNRRSLVVDPIYSRFMNHKLNNRIRPKQSGTMLEPVRRSSPWRR